MKPQKSANNAVPNYSTDEYTFADDNPYGDHFKKELEPKVEEYGQVKVFKSSGLK